MRPGSGLARTAAVLAVVATVALVALPIYAVCAYRSMGAGLPLPSVSPSDPRYVLDPVYPPPCTYQQYMDGSSGMAVLLLLLVGISFGLLVIRTRRFPAITAGLGLEWIAGWGYLAYWLGEPASQWDRVQEMWRLGFQVPLGGEGYLMLMLPAGVAAILAAAVAAHAPRPAGLQPGGR